MPGLQVNRSPRSLFLGPKLSQIQKTKLPSVQPFLSKTSFFHHLLQKNLLSGIPQNESRYEHEFKW